MLTDIPNHSSTTGVVEDTDDPASTPNSQRETDQP